MKKRFVFVSVGLFMAIFVLLALLPKDSLLKIPFSENKYVIKAVNASLVNNENALFEIYVEQMRQQGYEYIAEERMGALCAFEQNGEIKYFIYPRIKQFKWFI